MKLCTYLVRITKAGFSTYLCINVRHNILVSDSFLQFSNEARFRGLTKSDIPFSFRHFVEEIGTSLKIAFQFFKVCCECVVNKHHTFGPANEFQDNIEKLLLH